MLTFGLISCIFLNFLKIFWGLTQSIKPKVDIPSSFASWKLYEKFNFLIHWLHQEIFPNFCSFEVFLDQKIISKTVFSLNVWWQQWKNKCIVSINFLTHKTIGKEIFSQLFVSRNVFKKGEFCQFLASKSYNKIWYCFNIFCNFCVSENFDMSPVSYASINIFSYHIIRI